MKGLYLFIHSPAGPQASAPSAPGPALKIERTLERSQAFKDITKLGSDRLDFTSLTDSV